LRRSRTGLAEREHQQHRQAFQAPRQVRDEPQRRLVRPVQVIDGQ
jgi:hypothetical protein